MFEMISNSMDALILVFKYNLEYTLGFIAILWNFNALNWFSGRLLNRLGIYPLCLIGLPGIVFSPFLHVNFNHLFFNTIPLFVLANFVLIDGREKFIVVTAIIVVLSGLITWLVGRKAIHIGASSLIMGYFSYVLIQTFTQHSFMAIALAGLTVYYFAGLFTSLLPGEADVSWEGHLSGFVAGIAASFLAPLLMT